MRSFGINRLTLPTLIEFYVGYARFYCWAKDKEHAVKIANEKRTVLVATNQWVEKEPLKWLPFSGSYSTSMPGPLVASYAPGLILIMLDTEKESE